MAKAPHREQCRRSTPVKESSRSPKGGLQYTTQRVAWGLSRTRRKRSRLAKGAAGPSKRSCPCSWAQGVEQLSPEQLAQDAHGKEVVDRGGDPALAVERQTAPGDDAMDMGVKAQLASPGVQNGGDAELGAEAL